MKGYALLNKNYMSDWFILQIFMTKHEAQEIKEFQDSRAVSRMIELKQKIVPCEVSFNMKTWDLLRKKSKRDMGKWSNAK